MNKSLTQLSRLTYFLNKLDCKVNRECARCICQKIILSPIAIYCSLGEYCNLDGK